MYSQSATTRVVLLETKVAGDLGQVSEVRQEGNLKFLYKLKVDENALKKRNINRETHRIQEKNSGRMQMAGGQAKKYTTAPQSDTVPATRDTFESEFERTSDTSAPSLDH